jgi:hypothetical protein
MATPERAGSAFSTSGIITVVILLVGAIVVSQFPLDVRRPGVTEKVPTVSSGSQSVEARLWQDPFAAVERYREEHNVASSRLRRPSESQGKADINTLKVLANDLKMRLQDNGSVVVLGVMVLGGPYIEDAEHRRRTRYAVLSGLSMEHFVPDNDEHIGYVVLPSEEPPSKTQHLLEVIPFEWLNDQRHQHILVLWLDENAFQVLPLKTLDSVLSEVLSKTKGQPVACQPDVPGTRNTLVRILGPAGSTSLQAMVNELDLQDSTNRNSFQSLCNAIFVSAMATAPASKLRSQARDETAPLVQDAVDKDKDDEEKLSDQFHKWNMTFLRTAVTDRTLIRTLIDELERRGVTLKDPNPARVALISEWDTFYGRALPETFCKLYHEISQQDGCNDGPRVYRFSYMRGLDGVLPRAVLEPAEVTAKPEANVKDRSAPTSEWAEGRSQADYLRRLAVQLHQTDRDQHIRAIGVLGSDVYDKLLVLRAVRSEFPNVPVFTTDLDARLFDPRQRPWAQNLIVASGYDLEILPSHQRPIPPFRDAYQTSTFLAARLIASLPTVTVEQWSAALKDWQQQPRIFEIGRWAAHSLITRHPKRQLSPDCIKTLVKCADIHPPTVNFLEKFEASSSWVIAIAVGLAVVFVYAGNLQFRRTITALVRNCMCELRASNPWAYTMTVLIAGGAIGLGWLFWNAAHDLEGEPLTLFEGISMWPSQILRLCALTITIASFFYMWLVQVKSRKELTNNFFPQAAHPPSLRQGDLFSLRQLWRVITSELAAPPDQPVSAQSLWENYLSQSAPVCRWVRVCLYWLLFTAFTILLSRWLSGLGLQWLSIPYRGEAMRQLNQWLLLLTVSLYVLLLFAVVDVIRRCDKFTQELGRPTATSWSEEPLCRESEKLGIPKDYLYGWLDIQFIAAWTHDIGWMVYPPAVVLFLLILARASIFDNWSMSPILLFVYCLTGAYTAWCVFLLRRAAESTRRVALDSLTAHIIRATQQGAASTRYVGQLQLLKDEVESFRKGVFVSITQQPIVRAVLILLSTAIIPIIEYFSTR